MDVIVMTVINLANVLSVWFAARNNRLTWLVGFVAVAITAVLFFRNGHYMSFLFNVYSAVVCIFGHFRWQRKTEENDKAICWSRPDKMLALCLLLSVLIFFANHDLSNNPWLDSIGTAVSMVVAYLLVKQDVNAWLLYLASDVIYIYLGVTSGDIEYVVIYVIMMILAIYGTREFVNKYRANEKKVL